MKCILDLVFLCISWQFLSPKLFSLSRVSSVLTDVSGGIKAAILPGLILAKVLQYQLSPN